MIQIIFKNVNDIVLIHIQSEQAEHRITNKQ